MSKDRRKGMERLPLMSRMNVENNNNKTNRRLSQPKEFNALQNDIPLNYCSQFSCSDPQEGLPKCLQNGDLTAFSSVLADVPEVESQGKYPSRLPESHWINSVLDDNDRNLLQRALEMEPSELGLSFAQKLLQAGAAADFFNRETDMSLLHVAVKSGDLRKVEALLELDWNKADVSVTTQPEGHNPLHLSVNDPIILRRLLKEAKARVNAKDNCGGRTPLDLALLAKNRESTVLLIENGADLDSKSASTSQSLLKAVESAFPGLRVDQINVKKRPVHYTLDFLSDLLDKRDFPLFKAGVQFLDKSEISAGAVRGGLTLLQRASSEGLNDFVCVLLDSGADANMFTKENYSSPALLAASRGHHKVLESLLYKGKATVATWTPDSQETILHVILRKSLRLHVDQSVYEKSLNVLFENHDFCEQLKPVINKKDDLGNTALHFAAKSWPQKVVVKLLELGANIGIRNVLGEVPLSRIPNETLEYFLDNHCTQSKKDPDDYSDAFEVTFRYDFLAPPVTEEQLQSWDKEKQSTLEREALPETDSLWYIARSKSHRHLIKHPVLTSFMWLKWQKIRRLFNRNLRFYMLLVVLLTWYIFARFGGKNLNIRGEDKEFCSELNVSESYYGFFYVVFAIHVGVQVGFVITDWYKDFYNDGFTSCILGSWLEIFMFAVFGIVLYGSLGVLKWVLVLLLFVMVLREGFQMISSLKRYLLSLENWMEMVLLGLLGVILFSGDSLVISCKWNRHLAAIALLISWAELITMVGRHPKLSRYNIYVTMFYKVLESFFYFLIWFSFFIIAFACGFYIMLHRDNGITVIKEDDYKFFDSPWLTLAKTFTMFIGEIEFSDIPVDRDLDESEYIALPIIGYLFLLAFIFFIVVVLMNLLNGLAITDTGAIHARAEIVSNVTRVESVSYAESVLLGDPFDFLSSSSGGGDGPLSWLHRHLPPCAPLNALYSKSPTVRSAFQRITGVTGILLFFTLLPNKSARFPHVAKELLGGRVNAEVRDILSKSKDIARKKIKERSDSPEEISLEKIFSMQKMIMATLKEQESQIMALNKKSSI